MTTDRREKPMPTRRRSKTGTREWSQHSANCVVGCSHNCLYCYAAYNAARFGRREREHWANEAIDWHKVHAPVPRHRGVIMYPTAHDLTLDNAPGTLIHLQRLLAAGNRVLIVTKADLDVVKTICEAFADEREQLELRISITSGTPAVAAFWEPGAPPIAERIEALEMACNRGFRTSVACEPLLEPYYAVDVVASVEPWAETIWIGKCNRLRQRTAWALGRVAHLERWVAGLEAEQTDEQILRNYAALKEHPKLRWKDSYRTVLERHGIAIMATADAREK